MRSGLRTVRRLFGLAILLAVVLAALAYVVYAANGILDEVEARDTREEYDEQIPLTGTALAGRLTAVADAAMQEPITPAGETPADRTDPAVETVVETPTDT
ncbi:MAG: hypothetical protein EHM39_08940 [Chloroflexi bacterium]|nr:MAG: hypothetical protein EHM39_08940 [Chloroflexota bacterium]